MDFDLENELKKIRPTEGRGEQSAKPKQNRESKPEPPPEEPTQPEIESEKDEGLRVEHVQQKRRDGGGRTPSGSSENRILSPFLDWKAFIPLKGIFEHVGGARPVRLDTRLKESKISISGIYKPFLEVIQQRLRERYVRKVVPFPWGEYAITEQNKVLTTKASLIRFLLFDALRDPEGTQVQYAKQWLALHHPAFTQEFNPSTHLKPSMDELDIYAMVYVAHIGEYGEEPAPRRFTPEQSEEFLRITEQLSMMNLTLNKLQEELLQHDKVTKETHKQQSFVQLFLLLDSLGLVQGSLPRNADGIPYVLEQNRGILMQTEQSLQRHIKTEEERMARYARDRRLKR